MDSPWVFARRASVFLCCCLLAQCCSAIEYSFRRSGRTQFFYIERTATVGDDVPNMLAITFAFRTYLTNSRIAVVFVKQLTGEDSEIHFDLVHGRMVAAWVSVKNATTDIDVRYNDGQWHEVRILYDRQPVLRASIDRNNMLAIAPHTRFIEIRSVASVKLRCGNLDEKMFYGCFRLISWGSTIYDGFQVDNSTKLKEQVTRGCSDLCEDNAKSDKMRCLPGSQCVDHFDMMPSCDWTSEAGKGDAPAARVLTLNGGDLVKYETDVARIPLVWQRVTFTMEFLLTADENDNVERSVTKAPMQFVQFEATPDQRPTNTMSFVADDNALTVQRFVNGRRVNQISLFRLERNDASRFWHKLIVHFIEMNLLNVTMSYYNGERIVRSEKTVNLPTSPYFDAASTSKCLVYLGGNKDDTLGLFRGCLRNVYMNELSLIQQVDGDIHALGFLLASEFDGGKLQIAAVSAPMSRCRIRNRHCGPANGARHLECENDGVCGRTSTENRCFCTKFFEGRSCQFPVYLRTCDHYYHAGMRTSGYRYLQPVASALRQATPAVAYCAMRPANSSSSSSLSSYDALTVLAPDVHLANDSWLRVRAPFLSNDSLSLGSVFRLHYGDATRDFLVALVNSSAHCEQQLRYRSVRHAQLRLANASHFITAHGRSLPSLANSLQRAAIRALDRSGKQMGDATSALLRSAEDGCRMKLASDSSLYCEVSTVLNSTDFMPIVDAAFFNFLPPTSTAESDLEVQFGSLKCRGTRISNTPSWSPELFERLRGVTLSLKNHTDLLLSAFTGNTLSFAFRLEDNHANLDFVLFEQRDVIKISFVARSGFTKLRTTLAYLEPMDVIVSDSLADMRWHTYGLQFENNEARVQLDHRLEFFRLESTKLALLQHNQAEAKRQNKLHLAFRLSYAVVRDVLYGDPPVLVNFEELLNSPTATAVEGLRLGTSLQCDQNLCKHGATCREDWTTLRTKCECADPIGHYGERCEQSLSTDAVSLDGLNFAQIAIPPSYFDKNITFYFRTYQPNTVIMSFFGGDWLDRYVIFQLVNGYLQIDCAGFFELELYAFPKYVADGRWHRVRLMHRTEDVIYFHLDDDMMASKVFMFIPLNNSAIFIGAAFKPSTRAAPLFEGCIFTNVTFIDASAREVVNLRELVLGKVNRSDLKAIQTSGIHAYCVTDCDVDAVRQLCKRGDAKGTCVPRDWQSRKTTCDCPNSWLAGNNCSTDYGMCLANNFALNASCKTQNCTARNISFSFKLHLNSTAEDNIIFQIEWRSTLLEMAVLLVNGLHNLLLRQRNNTVGDSTIQKTITILEPGTYYLIHISQVDLNDSAAVRVQVTSRGTQALFVNITALHTKPLQFDRIVIGRLVGCLNNFMLHSNGKVHNLIQTSLEMMNSQNRTLSYSDLTFLLHSPKASIINQNDVCKIETPESSHNQLNADGNLEKRFAVPEEYSQKLSKLPPVRVFPLRTYLLATLSAIESHLLPNVSGTAGKLQKALGLIEDVMRLRDEVLNNLTMGDYALSTRSAVGIQMMNLLDTQLMNLTNHVYPIVRDTWLDLNLLASDKISYASVMDRIVLDRPRVVAVPLKDDIDWIRLVVAVTFVFVALVILSIGILIKVRLAAIRRRALKKGESPGVKRKKASPKANSVDNKRVIIKTTENGSVKSNNVRYAACNGDDHVRLVGHATPITPISIRAYPSPASSRLSSIQPNYVHYDDIDSQQMRPTANTRESIVELYDDELNRPIGSLRRIRALRFEGEEDAEGINDTDSRTQTNTTGSVARTPKIRQREPNPNDSASRAPVFRKGKISTYNDNFMMYSLDQDNSTSHTTSGSLNTVPLIKAPVAKIDSVLYQHGEEPQLACFDPNGHFIDPAREMIVLGSMQSRMVSSAEDGKKFMQSGDFRTLNHKCGPKMVSGQTVHEFPPPPNVSITLADGRCTCPVKHIAVLPASGSMLAHAMQHAGEPILHMDAPLSNGSHSSSETGKGTNNLDCSSASTSSNSASMRNSVMDPVWVKADLYAQSNVQQMPNCNRMATASPLRNEDDVVWYRQMC